MHVPQLKEQPRILVKRNLLKTRSLILKIPGIKQVYVHGQNRVRKRLKIGVNLKRFSWGKRLPLSMDYLFTNVYKTYLVAFLDTLRLIYKTFPKKNDFWYFLSLSIQLRPIKSLYGCWVSVWHTFK